MAGRGVLYIVWGEEARNEAARSIASLHGFGLAHHVCELGPGADLADKSRMFEGSPFEETLFLDTDTALLGDPEFGFAMAARHGVALAIAPACWAHRQWEEEETPRRVGAELVEYNTGVIFFDRSENTRRLFARWREISRDHGSNDQWSFAQAVFDLRFNPFVLQPNWNFRASPLETPVFGPIKVWHTRDRVPENVREWNAGPISWGKVAGGRLVRL